MQFSIISNGEQETIAVVVDGTLFTCTNDPTDPRNYNEIKRRVLENDESVVDLFDMTATANNSFQRLSNRIVVENGVVKFDGDAMNAEVSRLVGNFIREGNDLTPIINFLDLLMQNPNEHSREHLFRWTTDNGVGSPRFVIDEDGYIIAYKGLTSKNGENVSVHSGTAYVDDVKHKGQIPNPLGSTITMPRSEVTFDPANGCSFGLHVGTWSYASSFGDSITIKVRVNPRDVVSVPSDCDDQKMRVCAYTVLEEIDRPIDSSLYVEEVDDDDSDWEDSFFGYSDSISSDDNYYDEDDDEDVDDEEDERIYRFTF